LRRFKFISRKQKGLTLIMLVINIMSVL